MDERLYTINFSKIYALGRHRERARKAIKFLRAFSARHMKADEGKVVIGADVNEFVWKRGIQKPPRKLRVKMMKDKDGTVMVTLEQPMDKKEVKEPSKKKEVAKGMARKDNSASADVKREATAQKVNRPKKETTPAAQKA